MTADKNIYSNQRLSNEGMRFNPDYRRPSTSRELKEFTIKGQKICAFNNRGYYCMYSCCCNIDREDNTDVIYKEVKRS